MYFTARFPNVVDDFGEPVNLQTSRIAIDPATASFTLKTADLTDADNKALATQVNGLSFPGAILSVSVLAKTSAGDGLLVSGFNQDVATRICDK
jgi:hypothetical protein